MALSSLDGILRIFSASEITEDERRELFHEAVLMTLARATSADSNIHVAEVEVVRAAVEHVTGEEITTADVRVAANSRLFLRAPFQRFLRMVGSLISVKEKVAIMEGLREVIRADKLITTREIAFFNNVAETLELKPSDLFELFDASS